MKSNLDVKPAGEGDIESSRKVIRDEWGDNVKITNERYITTQEGSSNKFHYFAVVDQGSNFSSVHTYGRIGYTPKFEEMGLAPTRQGAIGVYNNKLNQKIKKGYKEKKI